MTQPQHLAAKIADVQQLIRLAQQLKPIAARDCMCRVDVILEEVKHELFQPEARCSDQTG